MKCNLKDRHNLLPSVRQTILGQIRAHASGNASLHESQTGSYIYTTDFELNSLFLRRSDHHITTFDQTEICISLTFKYPNSNGIDRGALFIVLWPYLQYSSHTLDPFDLSTLPSLMRLSIFLNFKNELRFHFAFPLVSTNSLWLFNQNRLIRSSSADIIK